MTNRENALAVLRYEKYDRLPLVAFGFWTETVDKWAKEGHVPPDIAADYGKAERYLMDQLGFDFNWVPAAGPDNFMHPMFAEETVKENPDGSRIIRDIYGLICQVKPGVTSIPAEIDTSLHTREDWERDYKWRFEYAPDRLPDAARIPAPETCELPQGLFVGSLAGNMRNMLGVEQWCYLMADDEELYAEIVDAIGGMVYRCAEELLKAGARYDYGHFWEDICFKNGPLVSPATFRKYYAPWYVKITALLTKYGIDIVSVDCDGCIDALLPIWLDSGVNAMFPIEVGTWDASLAPWREQYGRKVRGVGGVDKRVFAQDIAAVDKEIERLKPIIALGGYLPCPDHLIPPESKWELVAHYCERMRRI